MKKKVFITGGTGCIGTYILDLLLNNQKYECHLLCRTPQKIDSRYSNHNFIIHQGSMDEIQVHQEIISQCQLIIHIATDWSDSDHGHFINVEQTLKLFSYTTNALEKIIYFSR